MRLTKILILVLALALCLAGCKSRTEELALVLTEADFAQLEEYPNLKKLDLTGSTCYDAIEDYIASHPEVEVTYTVALAGKELVCCNPIYETGLTPRQRELADLLVNTSYSNADKATMMGLTERSV